MILHLVQLLFGVMSPPNSPKHPMEKNAGMWQITIYARLHGKRMISVTTKHVSCLATILATHGK